MVSQMLEAGCDLHLIAAAALQTAFQREELSLQDIQFERRSAGGALYRKLIIGVGRRDGIAPNHIVSAVASAANLPGREIGKIEIYDGQSVVGVPAARAEQIVRALRNLKINGRPAPVRLSAEKPEASPRPGARQVGAAPRADRPRRSDAERQEPARAEKPAARSGCAHPDGAPETAAEPARRGKIRLSESARARLLDASDLSRFEIRKPRESGLKSSRDFHGRKGGSRKPRDSRGKGKGGDRRDRRR